PAAHARRFLPVNLPHRIASHVIAKRVHFRPHARPIREMLFTFDRTETIVGGSRFEKPGKHDDFAADFDAALFEKETEWIARVKIEGVELHETAALNKKRRHDIHLGPRIGDR